MKESFHYEKDSYQKNLPQIFWVGRIYLRYLRYPDELKVLRQPETQYDEKK